MNHVRSTDHAVNRAQERFGFEGSHAEVCRRVSTDVLDAVKAGRMATRLPRFARRVRLTGTPRSRVPSKRFVWSADERRVYVIVRGSGIDRVLTCLAVDEALEEAA